MRTSISILFTIVLTFGLMGCRTILDPTFMPAGSTYHTEKYNSPPGPEADDIGYDYSSKANAETLQVWRIAVKDLVDQLSEQIGVTYQEVYVQPLPRNNAFNASYDHVLREELGARGYVLVPASKEALHLWYEAHVPKYVSNNDSFAYGKDEQGVVGDRPEDHKEFVLILTAVDAGSLVAKAAGMYKLPPYGFTAYGGADPKRLKSLNEEAH